MVYGDRCWRGNIVTLNGWDVQDARKKSLGIWKGILSVKRIFLENIKYHIGSRERILLWQDRWVRDRTLAAQFLDLFNCSMDKEAKVKPYMLRAGGEVVGSPILRRNLKDQEESQFISLYNLLNCMNIPERVEDEKVWTASKDGSFSVSFFFSAISNRSRDRNVVSSIWKIKAPPRVIIFRWIALRKRNLTMDNLRRRGRSVVNGCPVCLRDEESVDHLMLNCNTAQFIWNSVVEWFDCC